MLISLRKGDGQIQPKCFGVTGSAAPSCPQPSRWGRPAPRSPRPAPAAAPAPPARLRLPLPPPSRAAGEAAPPPARPWPGPAALPARRPQPRQRGGGRSCSFAPSVPGRFVLLQGRTPCQPSVPPVRECGRGASLASRGIETSPPYCNWEEESHQIIIQTCIDTWLVLSHSCPVAYTAAMCDSGVPEAHHLLKRDHAVSI